MSIAGIEDTEWPKSGKLTEAEVNARAVAWEHEHAGAFFAIKNYEPCCTGPCNQGRKLCPTPDACIKALDDFRGEPSKYDLRLGFAMIAASAVFVVSVLVAIAKALSWL